MDLARGPAVPARLYAPAMNRIDRLYALVEELRAAGPRGRTARQLAGRFEVSVRTIERDLSALGQAGVPLATKQGRTGGYTRRPLDEPAAAQLHAAARRRPWQWR